MQLTGYAGVLFSTLNVTCSLDVSSPGPSRSVPTIPRYGAAPIAPGLTNDVTTITGSFTVQSGASNYIEIQFAKLLALLNPDKPTPDTLTATILTTGPSTYTTVSTQAYVGSWRYQDQNTMLVDFIVTTPGWKAAASSTLLAATNLGADGSFANLNTGQRDVYPTLTIGALPPRGTKTASYGWEKKVAYTFTNSGAEPLINFPYQIGPIDTGNRVTGSELLASGDDLRIFCDGVEWPRNLIAMNTALTFIWVVIPWCAPGQTLYIDLVMKNASAGSPPTLTFTSSPQRPAVDISGTGAASNTSSTTTSLTVTGAGWETDQWDGGTIIVAATTGITDMRRLTGNTATVATISRAWSGPLATWDFAIVKSGLTGDGGTASGVAGTTLTDSSQLWRTNEWIGATMRIMTGTGAGSTGTVASNTGTAATVNSWSGTAPTAASTYIVYRANGVWMWDIREVSRTTIHKGLWTVNRSQTAPSQVSFDTPGSWYRFTYQRNNDAYSQPRYDGIDIGAGDIDYFPVGRLRRSRRGKAGDQTEVGVADAIGVSCPLGILGVYYAYTIRNAKKSGSSPSAGMCEVRGLCQESGGEIWATYLSDTATHNTTATVTGTWYDLTGYGTPIRIANTLIPNGSDEIQDTDNNTAEWRSAGHYVMIEINPTNVLAESVNWVTSNLGATFSTLISSCADVYLHIRTGGSGATRPYERLVIGGPNRKIFLMSAGATYTEQLKIDCDTHIVSLVDSAGTFIRRLPWVATAQTITTDADGSAKVVTGIRWLPITPSSIDSSNIYFSDPSGAGWIGNVRISALGTLGYWS
jgi:hypothetical protein